MMKLLSRFVLHTVATVVILLLYTSCILLVVACIRLVFIFIVFVVISGRLVRCPVRNL